MELNYKYSESTVKPEAIQIDGDTVYLRRDIAEAVRDDDNGGTIRYWTYQETCLTQAEFNAYASLVVSQNAIKGAEDSDKIAALMVRQNDNTEYTLTLMNAIADMYDVLAMLM